MLTRKTTALAALVLALAAPGAARAWSWPAEGPVLRGFEFGGSEYHEHGHSGIDIAAPAGSAVLAPASGLVSFAAWLPGNGRTATIKTADGYAVTLTHLGALAVSDGMGVAEGEQVGTIGPSGDIELDVPYLHLGIRRADDPKGYVDPLTLLPPRPAPSPPPEPAAPAAGVSTSAPHAPATAPAATVPNDRQPASAAAAGAASAGRMRRGSNARPTVTTRPRASVKVARRAVATRRATARPPAPMAAAASRAQAQPRPGAQRPVSARRLVRATPVPVPAQVDPPAAARARRRPPATARPAWVLAGAALLALAGAGLLAGRKVTREAPPIIASDDLLPDHTDLLRELDPAHRACVHDARGGHPRAPSRAAGRGHVLPHRHGRARVEGVQSRGGGRSRASGVRRPDRREMARAS